MSSPADDIAKILETNGFGVIGVDIYTESDIPPKPDNIIAISEVNSFLPPSPNLDLSEHYVQIRSRGARGNKSWARNKIEAVNSFLHGANNLEIGDVRYVYSFISSGPAYITQDENMRPGYTTDYRMLRTVLSASLRSIVSSIGTTTVGLGENRLRGGTSYIRRGIPVIHGIPGVGNISASLMKSEYRGSADGVGQVSGHLSLHEFIIDVSGLGSVRGVISPAITSSVEGVGEVISDLDLSCGVKIIGTGGIVANLDV